MMLKALFGRIWPYIAGVAGIVAGIFYVRQSGRAAGRQEVEQEQTRDALDSIRKSKENHEKVARMDDDHQLDEFERLHGLRKKKDG